MACNPLREPVQELIRQHLRGRDLPRWPALRPIPGSKPGGVAATFSPQISPFRIETENIEGKSLTKKIKVLAALEKRDPSSLHWMVNANPSKKVLPLGTQRVRLRRQWSEAVRVSLKKAGMDIHGKSLSQDAGSRSGTSLSGTLELTIYAGKGFGEKSQSMVGITDRIIRALIKSGLGTTRQATDADSDRQSTLEQRLRS